MRRPPSVRALLFAAVIATGLLIPGFGAADTSTQLRQRADALRGENSSLSAQSHSATLELYALDSRLSAAQARLASLRERAAAVRREQDSARHQLAVTRRVLAVSQKSLRRRLVAVYEQEEPSTLAVFLGAASLDDALSGMDHFRRFVRQDGSIIRQSQEARARLRALTRSLAERASRLQTLEADAEAAAAALAQARQERMAYISQLAAQRRLNDSHISSLEDQASQAETQARRIQAQQAAAPALTPAPSAASSDDVGGGGRSMTVVATAYALSGTTATGVPVGPGIVAVDPSVIPLGTRMTIPGYGEGIAADTGGAIIGARIDVWLPSEAEAQSWGVKTLTIYLH